MLTSVRFIVRPLLGGLVYPIVRAVDEKYVKADGQLSSQLETKILKFTDELALTIKHRPGKRIFYPSLSGLSAKKAPVAQEEDDQIDVLDEPKQVKKKLSKAFCEPGNVEENGVLPIVEKIIFPIYKTLDVSRPDEYGGDVSYSSFDEVKADFASQKLHPGDLKKGVESKLNDLLSEVQTFYQSSKELQDLVKSAFPVKKDKRPPQVVPIRAPVSLEHLTLDSSNSAINFDEKIELITRNLQEVL